ncbi:MAG: hypothetical protein JXJ04_08165 [Spirochaetales bacterium]|nr:hypothetical protein [Spirochaetales bacterium]
MRKALFLLILIALPFMAFAELQIGPTALYNVIFAPDEARSVGMYARDEGISLADLTFGLDTRLKIGIFQGSAIALFSPPAGELPTEAEIYLDAGIALDILFLRLGIGVGPNLIIAFDENIDKPVFLGGNVKISADIMLGGIAVSVNYLMYLPEFSKEALDYLTNNLEGNIGVSILFKL